MLYPIKFKPLFKERIWGGHKLRAIMGRKVPTDKKTGESWELSSLEGDVSVVTNGFLKGNNLDEILEVYMGELVGDQSYDKFGLVFPLLVKIIDAGEDLSVQVHPNDQIAKERHQSYGKTEMWYIIDCDPGAVIYAGFNRKVSQQEYLHAIEQDKVLGLLNRYEVHPGEVFYIPSGTIHSIGRGVLLAEVQQTSDITYRVDDFQRTDAQGNPRELHLVQAYEAINFGDQERYDITRKPIVGEAVSLLQSPWFSTNLIRVEGSVRREHSELDSFVVYLCTAGTATFTDDRSQSETIATGETLLLPAQLNSVSVTGNATLLEIFIETLR